MNEKQSPRSWSSGIVIGVSAALAVVALVVLVRPGRQGGEGPVAHEPTKRAGGKPTKFTDLLRPRSQPVPPEQPDVPEGETTGRIASRSSVAVTPSQVLPPARVEGQGRSAEPHTAPDAPPDALDEDEDIPALTKVALGDADPERRLAAIVLLSDTEDPQVIPVLAQALSDPDEEVRMAALESLSDFTGEAPVQAIESALRDPDADIRYEALGMLAEIGGDRVRSAMERALNDPDEDVRFLAENVLGLAQPGEQPLPTPPLPPNPGQR